jgi:hypothetical protein
MISIYVGPVEVRWAIGPKFFLGIKIFRVPVVPPRGAPARPVMFSPPPLAFSQGEFAPSP